MAIAKRRKRFFAVNIPLINKETDLQDFEIGNLQDRHIKYDLTRMLRGKSIILNSKVDVKDEKATASPKELRIMPYYLKRLVRKGTNYVEDSFSTNSKDSQLRFKPFLVTRRKVSRAVRKALRNKAKEEIINYAKDKKTEEIFDDILKNTLQKSLSLKLKKIYPLSTCEIRILKVEKPLEVKETPSKEEKKEAKKETTKKTDDKKEE